MKMDCNNLFPNYGHITDKFEFWIWLGVKFVLDNWSSLPQPKVDHDICCSVRLLTLKVKTMRRNGMLLVGRFMFWVDDKWQEYINQSRKYFALLYL